MPAVPARRVPWERVWMVYTRRGRSVVALPFPTKQAATAWLGDRPGTVEPYTRPRERIVVVRGFRPGA